MGRKKQKVRWTTVEDGFFDSTDNTTTSNHNTVLKNTNNQSNNYVEYVESEYNSVSSGEFCKNIREINLVNCQDFTQILREINFEELVV